MANQKLCSSCKHWNPADLEFCENCGHDIHHEAKARAEVMRERQETAGGWDIPIIKIKPSYPWYVKPFLYVARAIQIVGLAIGGAFAWSAFWAGS